MLGYVFYALKTGCPPLFRVPSTEKASIHYLSPRPEDLPGGLHVACDMVAG